MQKLTQYLTLHLNLWVYVINFTIVLLCLKIVDSVKLNSIVLIAKQICKEGEQISRAQQRSLNKITHMNSEQYLGHIIAFLSSLV